MTGVRRRRVLLAVRRSGFLTLAGALAALTIVLLWLPGAALASQGSTPGAGRAPQAAAPATLAPTPVATLAPTPDPTSGLTPDPTGAADSTGDPSTDLRSSGQGAGAAGNPGGAVWAFALVVAFGLICAGGTYLYIRATAPAVPPPAPTAPPRTTSTREPRRQRGNSGKSRDNVAHK